jgi:hypothetical protein
MSCNLFHMPYYILEYDFKFLKFRAKVIMKKGLLSHVVTPHINS